MYHPNIHYFSENKILSAPIYYKLEHLHQLNIAHQLTTHVSLKPSPLGVNPEGISKQSSSITPKSIVTCPDSLHNQ